MAYAVGAPLLHFLARKLDELQACLTTEALEQCNDDQLREIAEQLRLINARLVRLLSSTKQSGLYKHKAFKNTLPRIEARSEDLESLIEDIYLAVNPNFHKVVSSAVAKLGIGVEESATLNLFQMKRGRKMQRQTLQHRLLCQEQDLGGLLRLQERALSRDITTEDLPQGRKRTAKPRVKCSEKSRKRAIV